LKAVVAVIPPTFNTTEWNLIEALVKLIPRLQLPPMETLTWANLISTLKKVPAAFTENTLQELFDDVYTLMEIQVLEMITEND
jgi:hypothetical protein